MEYRSVIEAAPCTTLGNWTNTITGQLSMHYISEWVNRRQLTKHWDALPAGNVGNILTNPRVSPSEEFLRHVL